jgi:hypothetical protein
VAVCGVAAGGGGGRWSDGGWGYASVISTRSS